MTSAASSQPGRSPCSPTPRPSAARGCGRTWWSTHFWRYLYGLQLHVEHWHALVIGVGPGFCAGKDCHAVIETMRGHTLGRVIRTGEPIPNTNIPGLIGGFTGERVLRAPDDGIFHQLADIGARVQAGDVVGEVNGKPMACTIAGVIRGMLADGTPVYKGMKSGDVDPRGELSYCYTASDKAIAIGGGVLQAILEYTGVLSNVTGQNAWEV